jgi:hypothetical protein
MIANQATKQHGLLLESDFLSCSKQNNSLSVARQATSVWMFEVCRMTNLIIEGRYIIYKQVTELYSVETPDCRSQWPCGLTRGSWPVGCWDREFESRLRHGCLSASFCVVLSCVGRGLATGWSLVQGVLLYDKTAQDTSYMWGGQGPTRTLEPRKKKRKLTAWN